MPVQKKTIFVFVLAILSASMICREAMATPLNQDKGPVMSGHDKLPVRGSDGIMLGKESYIKVADPSAGDEQVPKYAVDTPPKVPSYLKHSTSSG
ncbi:hypothetical protein CROQUDRAFT_660235 [Cronartium quercuum f. sp. fusiforme G11]|uniref:Uncharacterized protein n=1 Tax=Cronartium quercuum f. sp. fusiforme G11 TaxID=708437 RepID=A0A9P6NES4_9BASI|nr:hypothetical protein CROQUDRAFT_660235 [Cronartium quercuum f. sp. fusiforme G11]